jgi:nucleoside-diphosphate-sugar epimerase
MKILVLGGTGAIGVPLVELLSKDECNEIYVTSRTERQNMGNITYIKGDAKNNDFLERLLKEFYDVIVDFMIYSTSQFEDRLPLLLGNTKQYLFFSSARCYVASEMKLTESSDRLIDACVDEEYLATDEYAIAKGREENLLFNHKAKNWTIIRPYITYNTYRMQLGVYEKENWLRRALEGRTIVMPRDILDKKTSLTYAPDVAAAVLGLIGNDKAYGQAFHITTEDSHTWWEILELYLNVIEMKTGKRPRVKILDNSLELQTVWNKWQIRYDRLFDRTFDNSKIESVRGVYNYKDTLEGLEECLSKFIENPKWGGINVPYEAWSDKQSGEGISLMRIHGKNNKIRYLSTYFKMILSYN